VQIVQSPRVFLKPTLLVAVILCASALAGCGPSPRHVVVKFATCIVNRDLEGAKKYTTQQFGATLDSLESVFAMMGNNPYQGRTNEISVDDLEFEITGDTARVWASQFRFLVYVLKKEKGYWKIDGFDVDFGSLSQMLQNMPQNPQGR
jgi:hypothetical protein